MSLPARGKVGLRLVSPPALEEQQSIQSSTIPVLSLEQARPSTPRDPEKRRRGRRPTPRRGGVKQKADRSGAQAKAKFEAVTVLRQDVASSHRGLI